MPRPEYGPILDGVDFRWSSSALETFLGCSLRFELEEKDSTPWTTVPMAIGTGVHLGAKDDAVSKRDTGEGLRLPFLVDSAVHGYDTEVDQCEIDAGRGKIGKGRDDAAAAALEYGKGISPLIQSGNIVAIEKQMRMQVDMDELGVVVEFVGTSDRVETIGVGDTKTGRQWDEPRVQSSRQLTGYGWLSYAEQSEYPQFLFCDNVYRTSRGWSAKRITTRRTDDDYNAFYDILVRATQARQAGVALPAPESSWRCSPDWCPKWRQCPAIIGRRSHVSK